MWTCCRRTSVEPALQIGTDYKLDRHWVANVDIKYEWMSFDVRSAGNKISPATVDPWLFRLAVGYKF
jgi:outer membrane protein